MSRLRHFGPRLGATNTINLEFVECIRVLELVVAFIGLPVGLSSSPQYKLEDSSIAAN